jgi:hypothetical protein
MAYGAEFNVGVNVAVGRINGNNAADIVTGASLGNPHVKVYRGQSIADGTFSANPDAALSASFFSYALNQNLGGSVAAGNIDDDGHADLVCGTTIGNPHVKIYRGDEVGNGPGVSILTSFFAYDVGRNLGVNVAVGDTNGDGFADVICGSPLDSSQVKVYDGKAIKDATSPDAAVMDDFYAYDALFATGTTVGAADFDGDGQAEIVTGASQGSAHYRVIRMPASGVEPPSLMEGIIEGLSGAIAVGA